MLLLKTILIFLKNKYKELYIQNILLGTLIISVIIGAVVSVFFGIGYVTYTYIYSFIEFFELNTVFPDFIPVLDIASFLKFSVLGLLTMVMLLCWVVIALFVGLILYLVFLAFSSIEYNRNFNSFINFIKSNWMIANITSGRIKKYVIYYNIDGKSHLFSFNKDAGYLVTFEFFLHTIKSDIIIDVNFLYNTYEDAENVLKSKEFKKWCRSKKIKQSNIKIKTFQEVFNYEVKKII